MKFALSSLLIPALLVAACVAPHEGSMDPDRQDSGWIGSDTFEVNAIVKSQVSKRIDDADALVELQSSPALQAELADQQLRFIKTGAEELGWRFNPLAEKLSIKELRVDGNVVRMDFEATVDMLGRHDGSIPLLDELERDFNALVPAELKDFTADEITACSKHSTTADKFFYYFAPKKSSCTMPMHDAQLRITKVFDRPTVFPEYDRLLLDMGDGYLGFKTALVPNVGDTVPLSRYESLREMLEGILELKGVLASDGSFTRYTLEEGRMRLVIDLYDPTHKDWEVTSAFRQRLRDYSLIQYNGHSAYGSQRFLDQPESFSDQYQIIMLHSCQSYAHYTRKIFRAKASAVDLSGFDAVDVIATGRSSHPAASAPTVGVLLVSLKKGLAALDVGEPSLAPSWSDIAEGMKFVAGEDAMYGIAGARTNVWQP